MAIFFLIYFLGLFLFTYKLWLKKKIIFTFGVRIFISKGIGAASIHTFQKILRILIKQRKFTTHNKSKNERKQVLKKKDSSCCFSLFFGFRNRF